MSKPPYSELENWKREPEQEQPEANEDVQARARQKLAELAQAGIFQSTQSDGWQGTRDTEATISYGEPAPATFHEGNQPPAQQAETSAQNHAPMPVSAPMPEIIEPAPAGSADIPAPEQAGLIQPPARTSTQDQYIATTPQTPETKSEPPTSRKKAKRSRKSAREVIADGANFAIGKKLGPIVPKGTIAGNALVLVIAIMSFLAALTVAAVTIVADATRDWQADIGRGATIQIRQIDGVDIETELAKAVTVARQTPGITSATALTVGQSNALLEPWLGLDLVFDDLPVPRLIELSIDDPAKVDFAALSTALQQQVRGAVLDNHRFWVERLRSMAESAIIIGFTILALVISATVLTVIFATRSAMSGNKETIEVLHFVGASHQFIAGEFQRKFFILGLQGSFYGGLAAILIFVILQFIIRQDDGSATLDQMQALLGVVELGYSAYAGTLVLIILIAIFTAITTRLTVMKTLSKLI